MQRLINRTLELEGFDTLTAAGGDEALALLNQINPDLIILDIIMPGIDGLETLDMIREQSNVPVIMLSAKNDMESLGQSFSLGADDFVGKPFSPRPLVARIRAKLRRTRKNPSWPRNSE